MFINNYSILFIFWNIFLALLPCWTVYFLATHKALQKNKLTFLLIFLFWLFMLPNTAYLFFMVRHLVDYCFNYDTARVCYTGSWMALFFFTYALIGLPTFYYALRKMTDVIGKHFGSKIKKVFPIVIIPITSLGLLFGLYERFNSWDIFVRPWQIVDASVGYLSVTFLKTDFLVFALLLYVIYYITDFLLKWHK